MESTSDRVLAVAGSLGVHALVVVVLFLGLLRQPELAAAGAQGPAMEAMLVSAPRSMIAAPKALPVVVPKPAPTEAAPPPQPVPEPKPQDAPKPQQLIPQARLPKPDTVDQDEVRRAGELAAEQKQLQEQDERRKQAQLDLSRQREQQEAENRQRQAQQELDRQKQLAEIRKERADADRQVKLQEDKMKQLADLKTQNHPQPAAVANPAVNHAPAAGADSAGLAGKYREAIRAVANENWHHDDVPERTHCIVHFTQLVGGEVLNVTFGDCSFDAAGKQSVEDALKKTPLPYAGFESVFQRTGTIDMCYPEEACK